MIARDCTEILGRCHTEGKSAGIPVISYDRLIHNADTDLYISFDNEMVGELMAEALVEAIPEGGEVFMIQGSVEDNNVEMVRKGFTENIENSNLQVVYEANCEGWIAEAAAEYVEEGLKKYPNVKGIMCGNDDIASRWCKSLQKISLQESVAVVGQDGDLAACQRIVEGTQYMTAFKSIEEPGRGSSTYAVKLWEREKSRNVRGNHE